MKNCKGFVNSGSKRSSPSMVLDPSTVGNNSQTIRTDGTAKK